MTTSKFRMTSLTSFEATVSSDGSESMSPDEESVFSAIVFRALLPSAGIDMDVPSGVARVPGLGARKSVIPQNRTDPEIGGLNLSQLPRPVYIGAHPVMGILGAIAGAVLLGGESSESIYRLRNVPDPSFHWAVIVGGYYHELIGDRFKPHFELCPGYQNGEFKESDNEFKTTHRVGWTSYSDQKIENFANEIMSTFGVYDVLNNNCQHFVLALLRKICNCKSPSPVNDPSTLKETEARAAFGTLNTVSSTVTGVAFGPVVGFLQWWGMGKVMESDMKAQETAHPTFVPIRHIDGVEKAKEAMDADTPILHLRKDATGAYSFKQKALTEEIPSLESRQRPYREMLERLEWQAKHSPGHRNDPMIPLLRQKLEEMV